MRPLFLPDLHIDFSQEWVLMRHMPQPFAISQRDLQQKQSRIGEHLSEQVFRRREAGLRTEEKIIWGKISREEYRNHHSRKFGWFLVYLIKGLEKWGNSRHFTWWNRLNLLRKRIKDFLSEYTFSKTCEVSIFHQGKSHHSGSLKSTSTLNSAN